MEITSIKIFNNPWYIAGLYIVAIFLFAIATFYITTQYSISGNIRSLNFIESLYFSVVTITTLGYGDILPVCTPSRIFVIFESVIGVLLIGAFINSIFDRKSKIENKRKHDVSKQHLVWHYKIFREKVLDICLKCNKKTFQENWKLQLDLVNMIDFNKYYVKNSYENWYEVLNFLEENAQLFSDLLMEIDLFSNQIQNAIKHVSTENLEPLRFLSILAQRHKRLKYSRVCSHEQVKYICEFVFEVMAGKSLTQSFHDEDQVLAMIDKL